MAMSVNVPDEKVYSVRLKKSQSESVMRHLESGVPQHIIAAALIHYFNDVSTPIPMVTNRLDDVLGKLDAISALIQSGPHQGTPPHGIPTADSTPIEGPPISRQSDPLVDDIESSVLSLLGD